MREIDPHLPIDSTAERVVRKGPELQHRVHPASSFISSFAPLPTREFTGPKKHDLTGQKSGDFVVVGCALYRPNKAKETCRWVVRCKCGRYQMLSSKAVKKNHENTACITCKETKYLKRLRQHKEAGLLDRPKLSDAEFNQWIKDKKV